MSARWVISGLREAIDAIMLENNKSRGSLQPKENVYFLALLERAICIFVFFGIIIIKITIITIIIIATIIIIIGLFSAIHANCRF